MDEPKYLSKPIYTIKALSLALAEPSDLLESLALRANGMYRHVPQKKKNGDVRNTYDAYQPLKRIQRKIVDRILTKAKFPKYLHGGIRDRLQPRSIYTNASTHSGAKHIVMQDIKDFFPSITHQNVYSVFFGLFGFGKDITQLLTNLSVRNGSLPQGASTSGYLANLIFWDVEPFLVQNLENKGFRYSRFADDITISSHTTFDKNQISEIISAVTNMLSAKGCTQKRSKLHIRKRGQSIGIANHFEPLTITGLSIYNTSPNISKDERRRIRSAVHEIEKLAALGATWTTLDPFYKSAMGRIGRLISCSHPDGKKFKDRLNKLKNYYKFSSTYLKE